VGGGLVFTRFLAVSSTGRKAQREEEEEKEEVVGQENVGRLGRRVGRGEQASSGTEKPASQPIGYMAFSVCVCVCCVLVA